MNQYSMYSADSSPSLPSELIVNYTTYIPDEQSSSSSSDETMPVIVDVRSINVLKSKNRYKSSRTSVVNYGPIRIRKRQTIAPTLATGRRSKDDIVPGEDAAKREIRRQKNRESARNLKKLRDDIEHNLANQVNQLESQKQNLVTQVNTLQIYKHYLEEQCQQVHPIYEIIARTASTVISASNRPSVLPNISLQNKPKEEPRSPSPEWQILLRI